MKIRNIFLIPCLLLTSCSKKPNYAYDNFLIEFNFSFESKIKEIVQNDNKVIEEKNYDTFKRILSESTFSIRWKDYCPEGKDCHAPTNYFGSNIDNIKIRYEHNNIRIGIYDSFYPSSYMSVTLNNEKYSTYFCYINLNCEIEEVLNEKYLYLLDKIENPIIYMGFNNLENYQLFRGYFK